MLPGSVSDGERILTWTRLYGLGELPAELVVVGSGATGAEVACASLSLGSPGVGGGVMPYSCSP